MLDEKDLQAIQKMIDASEQRIKTEISELRESLEEVRDATNYMVEWIDKVEKKVDAVS